MGVIRILVSLLPKWEQSLHLICFYHLFACFIVILLIHLLTCTVLVSTLWSNSIWLHCCKSLSSRRGVHKWENFTCHKFVLSWCQTIPTLLVSLRHNLVLKLLYRILKLHTIAYLILLRLSFLISVLHKTCLLLLHRQYARVFLVIRF